MVLRAVLTILVQSSSVFTSTLTPLAGAGLISLERAYPLTLGSNLGTTTTSILASFAAGGDNVRSALQIALVHLMFNLTGILLFYPIPAMRWPIFIARVLGDTTSRYRWFALLYLAFMFFIFPLSMFGLSLAGGVPVYVVTAVLLFVLVSSVLINHLQSSAPARLPVVLRDWAWLPRPLHSLQPWDDLVVRAVGTCCHKQRQDQEELKEVTISRNINHFTSVTYSKLPTRPRQRSSNSLSVGGHSIPQLGGLRVRSSHSFSHSPDLVVATTGSAVGSRVGYNKLQSASQASQPSPSPPAARPEPS